MSSKKISFSVFIVCALAAAFYLGRLSEQREPRGAVTGEEHDHVEEDHELDADFIKFDPDVLAKIDIGVAEAQLRNLNRSLEATGSVQVNANKVVHIRPLARGRIHDVYVGLGDRVKTGQQLLSYDNIELGEVLGQYVAALAEIQKSNSETAVAREALDRARSLVELGAIARAELQRREAEYRNSVVETESRKAKAAQIEEKLHRFGMTDPEIRLISPATDADYHRTASHSVLRSPLNGVITGLDAAPGENIDTEDELMTIADLGMVWVQADVYEKDIRLVREGSTADVTVVAHPERVFPGKIEYVSDVLDPQTRTAKVRVAVENPEGLLKVEMFATVRIPVLSTRLAVMVPAESIHDIDGRKIAFVRRGDVFEKRIVELGQPENGWIEITSGIGQGEAVVTEGSFVLKSELMKAQLGEHDH